MDLKKHVIMVQPDLFSMKAVEVTPKFNVGDLVIKTKGDYHWKGTIVGIITTLNDKTRIVVSHPVDYGEVLRIYNPDQLEVI